MPAHYPLHSLLFRVSRATCALAGTFLLVLQMLGPVLASPGQSMWVEICSEAGAVWVEVDLASETKDPTAPCPKCADCALCAVTTLAPLPDLPHLVLSQKAYLALYQCADQIRPHDQVRMWPETRGPPRAPKTQTERAPRASMAFTQIPGGAPWS